MDNLIVDVNWLKEHLNDPNLIILDSSPKSAITGESGASNKYIPGARKFNLKEDFSDKQGEFPNTFPSIEQFTQGVRNLGINKDAFIIVYDNIGVYTSPRVWWMFKVMGHESVAVLDGGLPSWLEQGNDVVDELVSDFGSGNFEASLNSSWVKSYEEILENTTFCEFNILDARSSGRFKGIDPEPREWLKSGAIPNSMNIPYKDVLNGTRLKPKAELEEIFAEARSSGKEIVYSCGSGLTACIVLLAGRLAGIKSMNVYDGSWTEWAEKQGLKFNP